MGLVVLSFNVRDASLVRLGYPGQGADRGGVLVGYAGEGSDGVLQFSDLPGKVRRFACRGIRWTASGIRPAGLSSLRLLFNSTACRAGDAGALAAARELVESKLDDDMESREV